MFCDAGFFVFRAGASRSRLWPPRISNHRKGLAMSLGLILLIVLILMLVGALPTWGHSRNWGYGPSAAWGRCW